MIFYDSSDLDGLRKWLPILSGATTNPLILNRDGVTDIPAHITRMVEIVGSGFPISLEIPDTDMAEAEMLALAERYTQLFPKNAMIKVPMDPRDPAKAFSVIYQLVGRGIKVNATLGLSLGQLIGAVEAGADYVSFFWGRRQDAANRENILGPAKVLEAIVKNKRQARVIVGSIRNVEQIDEALSLGADIVTVVPDLLQKWMYTQRGVETADEFNAAYRSVADKLIL